MNERVTGLTPAAEVTGLPEAGQESLEAPGRQQQGQLTVSESHARADARLSPVMRERLAAVRLLAMDVDGVLTDGTIVWSARPQGGPVLETKAFSVKDGLGLSLARVAGLQVAWITGRTSSIVERRAVELGVTELHQWARNKGLVLEEIKGRHALPATAVAFIGDDLNDVPAFKACGVRIAVADAAAEVQELADWVTVASGGHGAVREVIEAILRAQDRWEEVVARFYQRLEQEQERGAIQ
jgi:3-deoxy-D-manno-octulosonate 8-phosphate phosphatase (KDO 8-P phosphatase)